ncbi:MAG: hypothetical protein NZ842_07170 [Dehalococcoidia bacterium]|nr:hypothetical protein [Dehalococcoidia bacterium]
MSSEGFNPNEALWAKVRSLTETDFLIQQKESEELSFEGKPFTSLRVESSTDIEEQVEEAVLIEIGADDEEIQPEESDEQTVTLTESEYKESLAQARAKTESRLKEELEEKFRVELNQLKDQQADFFRAVLKNLTEGDSLVSEIASMSLKIGELLARSQLHLDDKIVSQFIESSIMGSEFKEPNFVSVRVSNSWQAYRASLKGMLPDGLVLVFDEALQPGDVIVSAGQGGYFDLLNDRIKMIEDQLSSIEYPGSGELPIDYFRQFFSENSMDDSEKVDKSDNTLIQSSDDSAASPDQNETKSEQTVLAARENQEQGDTLEPGTNSGPENANDEMD